MVVLCEVSNKDNNKDFSKMRGTYFCFTDFKNSFIDCLKIYYNNKDLIRYLFVGKEICPKTKKLHLQGYIQMFTQCRAVFVQKMFNEKFHIGKCRGTVEQNIKYCGKDGDIRQWGRMSHGQGYRSDWHNIKDDLKKGDSLLEIAENYTSQFIQCHSGIKAIKSLIDYDSRCKDREIDVTTIYGEAGSGKTSYVYKKHGYKNVFKLTEGMYKANFWGNYDGQEVLLIDEFNGWIKYKDILDILDRHPFPVNIKNGNTMANWTKVYIISNNKPGTFYKTVSDNLKRRVGTCLEVVKGNTSNLDDPWESENEENMYDSDSDSD